MRQHIAWYVWRRNSKRSPWSEAQIIGRVFDSGLRRDISRKQWETKLKLQLIANKKSYMGFLCVLNQVTLNDLDWTVKTQRSAYVGLSNLLVIVDINSKHVFSLCNWYFFAVIEINSATTTTQMTTAESVTMTTNAETTSVGKSLMCYFWWKIRVPGYYHRKIDI